MTDIKCIITDIWRGRGDGGESIYGPVFEGNSPNSLFC